MKDKILFIGPDFWINNEKGEDSPYFKEDKTLLADWQQEAKKQDLNVRVGRWTIPSEPTVFRKEKRHIRLAVGALSG